MTVTMFLPSWRYIIIFDVKLFLQLHVQLVTVTGRVNGLVQLLAAGCNYSIDKSSTSTGMPVILFKILAIVKAGGEINSVDRCWMTEIDRPPWIDVCIIRECTVRTGLVISVTTAVVGITS